MPEIKLSPLTCITCKTPIKPIQGNYCSPKGDYCMAMTQPAKHQPYGPGKFEGESCIARYAYYVYLNGFADYGDCDCEDDLREANDGEYSEDWDCAPDCGSRTNIIRGPFTVDDVREFNREPNVEPMCLECAANLLQLDVVEFTESDQGFIYSSA